MFFLLVGSREFKQVEDKSGKCEDTSSGKMIYVAAAHSSDMCYEVCVVPNCSPKFNEDYAKAEYFGCAERG